MGVRRRSSSASPASRKDALVNADSVPAPVDMCHACSLPIGQGAGVQIPFLHTSASSSFSSTSSSSSDAKHTYVVDPGERNKWFHHNCAKEWFRTHDEDRLHLMNGMCYFELFLESGRKRYKRR